MKAFGKMSSDVLAPRWIFYYLQVLGLHSVHREKSFSGRYQIFLLILVLVNYIITIILLYQNLGAHGSTLFVVSILDSIWYFEAVEQYKSFLPFFVVTAFSFAAGASICTSFARHDQKLKLIQSFSQLDQLISSSWKLKISYGGFHFKPRNVFITVWLASIILNLTFLVNSYISEFQFYYYAWEIIILNHIVYLGTFQFFLFNEGILNRLKIISVQFGHTEDVRLKEIFLKLYEMNQEFCDCFRWPILLNFVQLFFAVLINLYWLGISIFGIYFAYISGKWCLLS